MNILTEQQLEKLTTKRLLSIHRALTSLLGSKESDVGHALLTESTVQPYRDYDEVLHRVMAKREHVVRPLTKRTMAMVTHVGSRDAQIIIPEWDRKTAVKVKLSHIPEPVKSALREGRGFHVRANIAAQSEHDLHFSDWELH